MLCQGMTPGSPLGTSKEGRVCMVPFRKALTTLVVLLLVTLGVGDLWSIEADNAEGRPWDSGYIEVYGGPGKRPVLNIKTSFRIAVPDVESTTHSQKEQSSKYFNVFLNSIFSFLDY